MSNSKSIEVDIIGPSGHVLAHVSTGGATTLPPSAGVPLTASKTAGGKVTKVSGTISGTSVVVELPESAK